MDNVKTYYEQEAIDYNKEFYVEKNQYPTLRYRHNYMLQRIKDINLPANSNVLDVGCGPGEMIIDLLPYNWNLWGIDIADSMINIARKKVGDINQNTSFAHLETGDIEALRFEDNFFDLIICAGVIEYLADDIKWSKEIARVLKPGGILLINVTNKYSVRNWTRPVTETLKNSKLIYGLMNFIKQKILKKGKLHHFPFKPRLHSPVGFERFLADQEYEILSHNYFDFAIFPAPFDTLFGFLTIPVRKQLERYTERKMILNGTGYIVCARLKK